MRTLLNYYKRLRTFSGKILYINLAGMVVVSFLQGLETILLIPMISVSGIMTINSSIGPINDFFNIIRSFPSSFRLPLVLSIFIGLVIGQSLLQKRLTLQNVKIYQSFFLHLRVEVYRSILEANWDFFIKKRKSDLINLLTTELGRVGGALGQFSQLITVILFAVIQIALAFWLSPKLTLFVLVCGVLHIALTQRFTNKAKALGKLTTELSQSFLAGISDQLNGIKDIKCNTLEESRLVWLDSMTREMKEEQKQYVELRTSSQLYSKISSAIFISLFIFGSAKLFHAPTEQLLLVVAIFYRLWPRLTEIKLSIEQIALHMSAFQALEQLENESSKARELKTRVVESKHVEPIKIEESIECRAVSFCYDPGQCSPTLRDISLQIPAKQMTAIVGRSGAGKSTLIDLLMGILKPDEGVLLIDGTPIEKLNVTALRKSISYVPQDPFLFNGSIRDNLLLFQPEATEEEMWEALEFSASADFVRRFPKGLDTHIGDRGIKLSGGERQRLVLARAILRKPTMLILDEATSALDTQNEQRIQKVLEGLKGKMTIIVIAHRMSTIRNADQVLVLDQGKVVQTGAYSLLAQEKKGLFSNLLGNQYVFSGGLSE